MAEAVVSLLVEQLGTFLYHQIENEVIMVVGVKEEIQELTKTLTSIQAVLHDAEKKQVQDERVKVWLEDLKEAVYEIEDVLDDWSIKSLKSRIKKGSLSSSKKMCSQFLYPCFCVKNSILLRHSVGRKVKEIRKSLDSIASRTDAFGLDSITSRKAETSQPRERTSSLIVSKTYGRDKDRDILVNRIIDENCHGRAGASVVSIIGIGGLGKTTLAQLVSQDTSIKQRFGKPLWVCVSDPFDRTRLAKAIIFEVSGQEVSDKLEWNALHNHLMETLKDKLFLLILDDMWTDNTNDWDPLKVCLDGGAAGSVILVTTRKVRVAEMMSSVYTHHLQGLTDENSWSLLQFASSIGDETQNYDSFEKIGKAIALKCKGVPLSIKTLGSLLRFKKTKHDWERVLESEMWSLPEFVDTVNPALSLSYYDLPSSWKPCFIYCATFPKDHILEKDVLIMLWMAHGFLDSSQGRELEEIGEEYFNGIISRSLFEDVVKNDVGDIQSCKMHDLVHDFVHFLSNKETYIIEGDDVTFNNPKLHHLTVCSSKKDISTVSSFDTMKSVRTLNMHNCFHNRGLKNILCHWTNLRSLDISFTNLQWLPPEIEKLIHLRYLDLSNNDLRELPNTLGNLCNLQTLKLNGCCHNLRELPASMGKLINLRHLELDDTSNLRSLPKGIEKLTSLRSLSKFIVEEGRKLSDMKRLNLIQRKVEISGLCQVTDGDEAKEAELGSKRGIWDLTLNFRKYENVHEQWIPISEERMEGILKADEGQAERMEGVLEALQPPPHLEKLRIIYYPGSKLPSWMNNGSQFLKLRVLELKFDKENKCRHLPSLGKLRLLEELKISCMSLQRLDLFGNSANKEDASNPIVLFPNLIRLTLFGLVNLEEWVLPFERSDILQIMPCLCYLTIEYASKLKALPAVWKLESLKHLILGGLSSVTRVGPELFGIAEDEVVGMSRGGESLPIIIFPKLKTLYIKKMELEEWDMKLPNWREDITFLMPCLNQLEFIECTQVPSLGKLPLLEKLKIRWMKSLQRLDLFRICENKEDASNPIVLFPNLIELSLWEMSELEEWVLPFERSDRIQIMPRLRELLIHGAYKLKALPAVWKLESLEELNLGGVSSLRRIGPEFFGISKNDVMCLSRAGESLPLIIFPKLKILKIVNMFELEEWEMKMPNWREHITFLMPCLERLDLSCCRKLKVIPQNIFSYQLVEEFICFCPELKLPEYGPNQIIKKKEVGESSMTNEERTSQHNPSEAVM